MAHLFSHLRTILKHRHRVIAHCRRAGIGFQGLFHDLSKFSPTELVPGAKYYQGTRSPNEREREFFGYSEAWLHHKGRNRHHFEYWNDINVRTKCYEPVKMPMRYVKEMFCDRVAASKIYQGKNYTDRHPLDYFTRGNARKKMNPETADLLEEWLLMLAERGEKETFSHIKSIPNRSDYGRLPMTHHMNLNPEPFSMIESGQKTIELRLCDEKRQGICTGDRIIFTSREDPNRALSVEVVALSYFASFESLYKSLPLLSCGYTKETLPTASHKDMELYYSVEQQNKYGVLGIEIKKTEE